MASAVLTFYSVAKRELSHAGKPVAHAHFSGVQRRQQLLPHLFKKRALVLPVYDELHTGIVH